MLLYFLCGWQRRAHQKTIIWTRILAYIIVNLSSFGSCRISKTILQWLQILVRPIKWILPVLCTHFWWTELGLNMSKSPGMKTRANSTDKHQHTTQSVNKQPRRVDYVWLGTPIHSQQVKTSKCVTWLTLILRRSFTSTSVCIHVVLTGRFILSKMYIQWTQQVLHFNL